jgi:hypothetical protein
MLLRLGLLAALVSLRQSPKNAAGPPLIIEKKTLTCDYVARSERLEPPTFRSVVSCLSSG